MICCIPTLKASAKASTELVVTEAVAAAVAVNKAVAVAARTNWIGTMLCVGAHHRMLCEVQRRHPAVNITGTADDTYFNGDERH